MRTLDPGRLVVGISLVMVGVVAILDGADVVGWADVVADWWPTAVIGLGVAHAATDRRVSWGSGGLVVLGALLLLGTMGVFGERGLAIVWPVLLILVGTAVIVGWSLRRTVVEEPSWSRVIVASAPRLVVRSDRFERGDLTVIAGSARVDLTRTRLDAGGGRMSVTVIAGSVEVVVPEGWRVVVRGVAVLGGWDDTTSRRVGEDAPTLEVRALAVVGGVDVRHRRRWS
ncbi:MAG TPA: hypothetical protein VLD62_03095 [Acidimicrobiia bacterium]|nr:hypothetical protein [Acidimicrobiia bacterium]